MPRIVAFLIPALLATSMGMYFFSYYSPLPQQEDQKKISIETIGASHEGRPIESHTFGDGLIHIAIVGGMHGGYEWNTSALAYQLIEYYTKNPDALPISHRLSIIPVVNPDGLYAVAGTTTDLMSATLPVKQEHGRFNAHAVDLNRNFDCQWQPESNWGMQKVSAGSTAFSEPETQALRSFVESHAPDAFIFLHSAGNAVYGSQCNGETSKLTSELLAAYGDASGYTKVEVFDAYPITGDAEGWLASIGIPAITVELADHENTEFDKNLRGVEAVLRSFREGVPFYSY